MRFSIDLDDLYRVTVDADDAGQVIWGIVHSHVRTAAIPSPTDVEHAHYPDALYLVVSLDRDPAKPSSGPPSLRAWRIIDGTTTEVPLEIT